MQFIELTQGYVAAIDNADYDRVAQYKWHATTSRKRSDGSVQVYATRNIAKEGGGRTRQMLHRFIMTTPIGLDTDHINGNGLDNTRKNLRICTRSENAYNQRPQLGTSCYKGVYWSKCSGKWQGQIAMRGKCIHLGLFVSERDAAIAYNNAALQLYGDFAHLNRVDV